MHDREYDVIVIGGGASGLMAAAVAAERGKRVLLVEKNPVLGKKLAITGGGRCNILNAETDLRTLLSHYGDAAKFLHSPFAAFSVQDTWDFFEQRGLPLVVEARQRVFPESGRASDVVQLFQLLLKRTGVTVRLGEIVEEVVVHEHRLASIRTNHGEYRASAYVFATGGLSHPETGSTGDGLQWLRTLGHTVHQPNPALVPLITTDAWGHALSGTSLEHARITFSDGVARVSKTGRILFTHFGLSGPTILNAAAEVLPLLSNGPISATIDLFPGADDAVVQATVHEQFTTHSNKTLKNVLKHLVPPGMGPAVASLLPASVAEAKVHSVTRDQRQQLIMLLRTLPLTVTGTKGNDWSVVADGGLDLREVDTKTMQSRLVSNLYLTGDVLHIPRPTGGYSLQLCWTTGAVVGRAV